MGGKIAMFLGGIVNTLLRFLGLRLTRIRDFDVSPEYYVTLIKQFEACHYELMFPELPVNAKRTDLLCRLLGTPLSEAMYILEHLHKSMTLPGDICEFGVAQGATTALMANEIMGTDKSLWLFDSFQGLPKPDAEDILIDDIYELGDMDKYSGAMQCQQGEVISRLKAIDFPSSRVNIIVGFIEDTLKSAPLPEKVCFAYLDLDLYSGTKQALEYLNQSLVDGGYIVIDDYGFFSSGVEKAVSEFVNEFDGRYVLTTPRKFAGNFCILHKLGGVTQ